MKTVAFRTPAEIEAESDLNRSSKIDGSAKVFSLQNIKSLLGGRMPGQLIIQITDNCNAHCPQCEMRVKNRYVRTDLQEGVVYKALEAASERNIAAVSFTGGEPFLDTDRLVRYINYAGECGIPYIRTGTNAYMFRSQHADKVRSKALLIAEKLAETPLRNLWFSLDSAEPQVHDSMRGMAHLFSSIEQAASIFHDAGIWPTANLGINRNLGGLPLRMADNATDEGKRVFRKACYDAFDRFLQRAVDMGFTIVNFCYPMSVESDPSSGLTAAYRASSADDVVRFTPEEKIELFSAMFEVIQRYRSKIRIFTPRSMLFELVEQYQKQAETGYGCRGGIDFFFMLASDGQVYPCGFRSDESMGPFEQLNWKAIDPKATCKRCDWECFRDPSTMAGPLLDVMQAPGHLIKRLWKDSDWMKLWWQDLRYQRATDYCNGRVAPDYGALSKALPQ